MEGSQQAIEAASPARLFAALAGAALFAWGLAGFFQDSSFASPDDVGDALGLLAGFAARRYAVALGALYAAVAVLAALTG
jgi:hypothetical protein